jgi:hypothetical protein
MLKSIEEVFTDYAKAYRRLPPRDKKKEEEDPVYRGFRNLQLIKWSLEPSAKDASR